LHSKLVSERASSTCNLDVTCQAAWSNESKAVARMIFSSAGGSYLCSGTLLSDKDLSSSIPYFLTANHCISTQTEASSLETYWFYHASACNSSTPYSAARELAGGATLLYANADTDTSFMRLNSSPPVGVVFAGWDTNLPAIGSAVTSIHHPSGDLQK
ncbi:serine protease, partial [bacterium]|nr:serine protease [bacterium]